MKKILIVFSMFSLFFTVSCSVRNSDNEEINPGITDTDQTGSDDETQSSDADMTGNGGSGTDTDSNDTGISDNDTSDDEPGDHDGSEDPADDSDNAGISDDDTSDDEPGDHDGSEDPADDSDNTGISDDDTSDDEPGDHDGSEDPADDSDNTGISDNDTSDDEPCDHDGSEDPADDSDNAGISDNDTSDNDPDDTDDTDDSDDSDNEGTSDEDTDTDIGESTEIPECSSSSATPCRSGSLIWSSRSAAQKDWENAKSDCSNWSEGTFTGGWRLPTISELRTLIINCQKTETNGNCGVTDQCVTFYENIDGIACYSNSSCNKLFGDICPTSQEHSILGDKIKLWSSSYPTDYPGYAWVVDFNNGSISFPSDWIDDEIYYRCVHSAD